MSVPQPAHVRGAWPVWLRLAVLGLVAGAVGWALVSSKVPALWPKVLVVAGGLALMAGWWQGHRRHEVAVQMDRRARELRRRMP
jgi:hypothetical protein